MTLRCRLIARPVCILLLILAGLLTPARSHSAPVRDAPADPAALQRAFAMAAQEWRVPERVLLAVAYNLSRWEVHGGAPSVAGGYGPMHLVQLSQRPNFSSRGLDVSPAPADASSTFPQTLHEAARLLEIDADELKRDPTQNIRGGAALLHQYALATTGRLPTNEADWYGAVARYSGSNEAGVALDFARAVYATLRQGAARTTSSGQRVALQAAPVTPNAATTRNLHLRATRYNGVDCPPDLACSLHWAAYNPPDPADATTYGNYDLAARPTDGLDIQYIIIHNTEIDYATTVRVFQNPATQAATHYLVRSSDGHVAQFMRNKNVAWHAGNWHMNGHSLGIEHEGIAIQGASWYTEPMYRASAKLVRYLAQKYGVPLDRAHIIGHDEIPGPTPAAQAGMHWDPGPFWDWAHYMELLGAPLEQRGDSDSAVVTINPSFEANRPPLTYCYDREADDCRAVPSQSANFVYLYSAPDFGAPLIGNEYIGAAPTDANNWANKAVTGQQFYRVAQQGEWDAIYFGGQTAWFHNPSHRTRTDGDPLLITPRAGRATIPVYGRAYPEHEIYPTGVPTQTIVPIYTMPAGHIYVAADEVQSSYFYAPTYVPAFDDSRVVVLGQTRYYRIFFNHRFAYVRTNDVDVVK